MVPEVCLRRFEQRHEILSLERHHRVFFPSRIGTDYVALVEDALSAFRGLGVPLNVIWGPSSALRWLSGAGMEGYLGGKWVPVFQACLVGGG